MTQAAPVDLVATYRLQLHRDFDFDDAVALLPYLRALGVSHVYLSPILQAVAGSPHGYDQCDPTRISEDLGGAAGFARLAAAARENRIGILLDIVPNHVAASDQNPWWWELLRSGREGARSDYFDIDWRPPEPGLRDRVLLPVLGAPEDEVLASGAIARDPHEPALVYGEQRFPLRDPGPGPVDRELLGRQHYQLAYWRDARTRLNYRRFFDINSLVAVREERPEVFADMHRVVLELVERDDVAGLRVDHVDGLLDPAAYLEELRGRAPHAWLLVEKILGPVEALPEAWPVDGTTGYDFMNRVQGVFIDPAGEAPLTAFYTEFTGCTADFAEVAHASRVDALRSMFLPDAGRVERLLAVVGERAGVASSAAQRLATVAAVAASMGVYRTYVQAGSPPGNRDRSEVERAVKGARQRDPGVAGELLDLLRRCLTGDEPGEAAHELALRFQQLTGPLMAKGVEDTAFYRYNRLVSLNEVGGDPGSFGTTVQAFHEANRTAAERTPRTLLAGATHDTKRSEDVRARLSLLAQVPAAWTEAVMRWATMNERHRVDGRPDRNIEYLLYQVLVGAWPLAEERALAFMEKAAREAKVHTSWTDPDDRYETALRDFTTAVMRDGEFQRELAAFVAPMIEPGFIVSLAQCLLRLTSPGIPDIYQGTELWDLSLVDPDNRRPVDFGLRRELLALQDGVPGNGVDAGDDRWSDGLAKLHVTRRALRARRDHPQAFAPGSTYTPLTPRGPAADQVIAFARGTEEEPLMVVTVVPRLVFGHPADWSETTLDLGQGEWTDLLWEGGPLRGPRITLESAFERHALALLARPR